MGTWSWIVKQRNIQGRIERCKKSPGKADANDEREAGKDAVTKDSRGASGTGWSHNLHDFFSDTRRYNLSWKSSSQ